MFGQFYADCMRFQIASLCSKKIILLYINILLDEHESYASAGGPK